MAEAPKSPEVDDEASELRGKLVKRLAFAGVLVAMLLGTLTFFDYLASPPDEGDVRVFSEPVPVAPRKEVSQPVKPTDSLPEPPSQPEPEPVVETPPPPPEVAPQTAVVETKPEKTPAAPSEKRVVPSPAAATPKAPSRQPTSVAMPAQVSPVVRPSRPVIEEPTYPPVMQAPPAQAVSPTPSARVTEVRRTSPQVVPPSSIARLFSGFSLQAGVFANTQRAEELHAKLTLSGLPSTLETRVQVGPFRSRQEAEAAQEKLRELGVETVLLAPKGAKP